MRRIPRTPRGRAAMAALAVGGGVALVTGVTAAVGVAQGGIFTSSTDTTLTTVTTVTTVKTDTTPTATTVITQPPPPPAPLEITKDATLVYTRVNTWDIDKWASPQAGWDRKDQSVAVDYSVKVTRSWKAENIHVVGTIAVRNPNEAPFFAQVGDSLPGGDCTLYPQIPVDAVAVQGLVVLPQIPGIVVIPGGTTGNWRYDCVLQKLPKKKLVNTGWVKFAPAIRRIPVDRVVPVDATAAGEQGLTQTATAPAPPVLNGYAETKVDVLPSQARVRDIDGTVKVIDTLDGDQTRLLADELSYSKTFTYKRYLSFWRMKKICRTWHNVAKVTPVQDLIVMGAPPKPLPETEWSKTAEAWVKICPPPPPVKGEDPAPPKVEVSPGPDDKKSDPVVVKPVDNPKGPVIKDNKTKGRLLVSKWTRTRVAQVGDIVTWNIRVKNIGKAELYGVKVVDVLPKHLVPVITQADNGPKGVVFPIGDLAPGDSDEIQVSTRVVGKPAPTPDAVNVAKRIKKAKDRDEALRRLRKGLVCNVVRATARKAGSDVDIACIRIVKERVEDLP